MSSVGGSKTTRRCNEQRAMIPELSRASGDAEIEEAPSELYEGTNNKDVHKGGEWAARTLSMA